MRESLMPPLRDTDRHSGRAGGLNTDLGGGDSYEGALVIEDDRELCAAIDRALSAQGFSVLTCGDGEEGLFHLSGSPFDAAVVDRMLPSLDGATVVRRARKNGVMTPVIMATALGQIDDRIEGLECGADDYIVKPFDLRELSARIRALARRPAEIAENETLSFEDVVLLTSELTLRGDRGQCPITKKEAEILEFFFKNPQKTLSRELVFSRVWGAGSEVEEASLDIYLHYIRRHLSLVSGRVVITTLRRVGYRLECAE